MHLFSFKQYKYLIKSLKKLPELRIGEFDINRFPNQELFIKIHTNVENRDCLIMGTITPPDENLVSLLLLSHTIKKGSASKIIAILPYLAYTRQDKAKTGESLAAESIGGILRASHINEIVTVDIHSNQVKNLYPIPIHNLSPAKLFAKEIKKLKIKNPTFVAPDEGAMERVQKVIEVYGTEGEIAFMKKKRTSSGVSSVLYGHATENAVVIDDILDTGGTLLSSCEILKSSGVKNIYIFVTHGLFTGSAWQRLFNFNVKKIYCTNSNPNVYALNQKNVEIISIGHLFEEYSHHHRQIQQEIKRVYREVKEARIIEPEEPLLYDG